MPDPKLGVLTGAGSLPKLIIAEALRNERPVFAIAFNGYTDPDTVTGIPHAWFRLGNAGAVLKTLRREGVRDVVFAGAIRRPTVTELRPDLYTIKFFARLGWRALGDDGLLRALAGLLEEEGFRVIGASDIVNSFVIEKGILGAVKPTEIHSVDIEHGFRVVETLGALDIGQAVVVQQGFVLGVEGAEGTDRLIARCADLARGGSRPILVKGAKPQQDSRLDMPTIGLSTIEALAVADFAGLAIEAGRTIMLDAHAVTAAADRHGLFISAQTPDAR